MALLPAADSEPVADAGKRMANTEPQESCRAAAAAIVLEVRDIEVVRPPALRSPGAVDRLQANRLPEALQRSQLVGHERPRQLGERSHDQAGAAGRAGVAERRVGEPEADAAG